MTEVGTRKRWLITGATGMVGEYLRRSLGEAVEIVGWSRTEERDLGHAGRIHRLDLADGDALARAWDEARPHAVVHLGAVSAPRHAREAGDRIHATNVTASEFLAHRAAASSVRMVFTSTDMVFDGERAPYVEEDAPSPLEEYGRSKARAEAAVLAHPDHVVARLSLLYGAGLTARTRRFFDQTRDRLSRGETVSLIEDEWRTPLHVADCAEALRALVDSDVCGVVNLGGPERLSRLEMGERVARAYGLSTRTIRRIRRDDLPGLRPRDLSLVTDRWRSAFPGTPWRTMDEALAGD